MVTSQYERSVLVQDRKRNETKRKRQKNKQTEKQTEGQSITWYMYMVPINLNICDRFVCDIFSERQHKLDVPIGRGLLCVIRNGTTDSRILGEIHVCPTQYPTRPMWAIDLGFW